MADPSPDVPQALVLAGGEGTRLRPLTQEVPKPMVPVGGRPFLEILLERLRDQGVREVVLSIGYLGEQVRDHFGNGDALGLDLHYAVEDEPLGTGGGVKTAEPLLDDRFLLLYGDTYVPVDVHRLVDAHDDLGTTGVLAVYENRDPHLVPHNLVLEPGPDEDPGWGRVRAYDKTREAAAMNGVEAGASLWSRDVCDRIPVGEKVSLEKEVYPDLIEDGSLGGLWTSGRFYDIGTPDRLEVARDALG